MTAPSPDFSINGGTVNEKVSVAASAVVIATIDDIAGVGQVTWSISRTDEESQPSDYDGSIIISGSVSQVFQVTALALVGRSAIIKAVINAGNDPQTERPSDATIREVKFFVPTESGDELLTAGETDSSAEKPDRTSSPTHGAVAVINAAIRTSGSSNAQSILSIQVFS